MFNRNGFIPGQAIPKGLHVRINLETGKTEAKLLDDQLKEHDKRSALINVPQEENKDKEEKLDLSKARLKEALKNIKNDDVSETDNFLTRVTEKFKKYEDIKKELDKLNLSLKTDSEMLSELFKKYDAILTDKHLDKNSKAVQILNILEDMEYLVHQIDNAEEFVRLNGFEKIIYKNFNSSSTKVKCQVLSILGSAMQNNPKIQIHALETGSADKLLRILALENNHQVLSRTIYAISSLLRRFPLAQEHFVKNGGLSVFASVFEKPQKIKLQIKIITLLYDLLMEQKNALQYTENPDYEIRLKQCNRVDLKTKLRELKWCNIFSNILKTIILSDKNNHDSIEKCLNTMYLVQDVCGATYRSNEVLKMLQDLNDMYKKLSIEEVKENMQEADASSHTFYFQKMKELTDTLINNLSTKSKTEL